MTNQEKPHERSKRIREGYYSRDDFTGWFDEVYATAEDERDVPWAKQAPTPLLKSWPKWPGMEGKERLALVVGCGLGDDAEELARKGFRVTAFDISETAIGWAKRRFPDTNVDYRVADLYNLPHELKGRFDFVLESSTLQSLPTEIRPKAIDHVSESLSPGGTLLVICLGFMTGEELKKDSPWGLKREELNRFVENGLEEVNFEEINYTSSKRHPGPRYRIEYRKPK